MKKDLSDFILELINSESFLLESILIRDELDEFEKKYNFYLPETLRIFFLNLNGAEIINSQTELAKISNEECVEGAFYLNMNFNGSLDKFKLEKNVLAIAKTNFGNLFLFNLNNEKIYCLDHETGEVFYYSENIQEWLFEEVNEL